MSNKQPNITKALSRIANRFTLISVAAERARQIQEYQAKKATEATRERNTLPLLKARSKNEALLNNRDDQGLEDFKIYVEHDEDEKPTILALLEIQEGKVDADSIENSKRISKLRRRNNDHSIIYAQSDDMDDIDEEFAKIAREVSMTNDENDYDSYYGISNFEPGNR